MPAPAAEQGTLAFRPAEDGYVTFDTGLLRGKVRLDGKRQGVSSLVYSPTGTELLESVGLMSYYRVFSAGKRYGDAAFSRAKPVLTRFPGELGRRKRIDLFHSSKVPDYRFNLFEMVTRRQYVGRPTRRQIKDVASRLGHGVVSVARNRARCLPGAEY